MEATEGGEKVGEKRKDSTVADENSPKRSKIDAEYAFYPFLIHLITFFRDTEGETKEGEEGGKEEEEQGKETEVTGTVEVKISEEEHQKNIETFKVNIIIRVGV